MVSLSQKSNVPYVSDVSTLLYIASKTFPQRNQMGCAWSLLVRGRMYVMCLSRMPHGPFRTRDYDLFSLIHNWRHPPVSERVVCDERPRFVPYVQMLRFCLCAATSIRGCAN